MATGARHTNTFDFLRLFAATVVVIAHAGHYLHAPFLWGAPWVVDGVAVFFVISGMLVYRSAERSLEATGSLREYWRNRYLRIAPAIYAFAITMPLLYVALTDIRVRDLPSLDMVKWLASSAVLLPNTHPAMFEGIGDVNGHLYTIPAEISYYLAIPVIIFLARRIGFGKTVLLLAPVAVAGAVVFHLAGDGAIARLVDHSFLKCLAFFLAGTFWAKYWDRAPKQLWVFALALAVHIGIDRGLHGTAVDDLLHPVLIAIPLSYCVVWFGYEGPRRLARLTNYIGDLSFGVYIWHMPVVVLFAYYGWTGRWWVVPTVVLVSWAMGALSFWLVERHFLRRKRVSEREFETGQLVPGGERSTARADAAASQMPGQVSPQGAGRSSRGDSSPS